MTSIIKLKTVHFIEDKPVYCDVITDYGVIAIPFSVLKNKAKLGEVYNCTYQNKLLNSSNEVDSIIHDNGITLFHISFDKPSSILKSFTPRVPNSAAGLEDKKTKRVCFSDSIEGALSAIPDGVDMLSDGTVDDIEGSSKTMYVGNITVGNKDKRLIDYMQLYNTELVFDALSTHEYWWTTDSILLSFSQFTVDKIEEEYHYIVSDSEKDNIADEFEDISSSIAGKIRDLCGDKLYNYINKQLNNDRLAKDCIGKIMFNLGIDDIIVVKSLVGKYESIEVN